MSSMLPLNEESLSRKNGGLGRENGDVERVDYRFEKGEQRALEMMNFRGQTGSVYLARPGG